jgi:hypothetical protein
MNATSAARSRSLVQPMPEASARKPDSAASTTTKRRTPPATEPLHATVTD